MTTGNVLYYGDNLKVLRDHIASEIADLIYLDPPFNSNANYNVLFEEKPGEPAKSQLEAFADTWEWDDAAADAYRSVTLGGGRSQKRCRASCACSSRATCSPICR